MPARGEISTAPSETSSLQTSASGTGAALIHRTSPIDAYKQIPSATNTESHSIASSRHIISKKDVQKSKAIFWHSKLTNLQSNCHVLLLSPADPSNAHRARRLRRPYRPYRPVASRVGWHTSAGATGHQGTLSLGDLGEAFRGSEHTEHTEGRGSRAWSGSGKHGGVGKKGCRARRGTLAHGAWHGGWFTTFRYV